MSDKARVLQLDDLIERASQGIVSKTVHESAEARTVLFTFDAGQQLTEHRASRPAVIHVLEGAGAIGLGANVHDARAGTWIFMPADLPHTIRATEPLMMLLTLLGPAE